MSTHAWFTQEQKRTPGRKELGGGKQRGRRFAVKTKREKNRVRRGGFVIVAAAYPKRGAAREERYGHQYGKTADIFTQIGCASSCSKNTQRNKTTTGRFWSESREAKLIQGTHSRKKNPNTPAERRGLRGKNVHRVTGGGEGLITMQY